MVRRPPLPHKGVARPDFISISRWHEKGRQPQAPAPGIQGRARLSCGGFAASVGTPPNVNGIGFIRGLVKEEVTFFGWMAWT